MTWAPSFTFTIRVARDSGAVTEFVKRVRSIANGTEYPRYTTQSYVLVPRRAGLLLAIGIVETRQLYGQALLEIEEETARFNEAPNAIFQYIDYADADADWFQPGIGWSKARYVPSEPGGFCKPCRSHFCPHVAPQLYGPDEIDEARAKWEATWA
jgi:hypothetical protein